MIFLLEVTEKLRLDACLIHGVLENADAEADTREQKRNACFDAMMLKEITREC